MRVIYVDLEHKCHIQDDGTMTPIETNFFDGKCDEFVQGFCYKIDDVSTSIYSWKDYTELYNIQLEYERAKLAQYENKENELITSYIEGINSI